MIEVKIVPAALRFCIAFTVDQLASLHWAAKTHYDYTCREAARVPDSDFELGGFLTRALQIVGESQQPVDFTWRELDLLSKICEARETIPPATSLKLIHCNLDEVARILQGAFKKANELLAGWQSKIYL